MREEKDPAEVYGRQKYRARVTDTLPCLLRDVSLGDSSLFNGRPVLSQLPAIRPLRPKKDTEVAVTDRGGAGRRGAGVLVR